MGKGRNLDKECHDLQDYAHGLDLNLYRELIEPFAGYAGDEAVAIGLADVGLQLLQLGLSGEACFSQAYIQQAYKGRLYHPREFEEVALARADSRTDYAVWSWKVFLRNTDDEGHIVTRNHTGLSDALRYEPFEARIQNTWLCDNRGLPDLRVAEMQGILGSLHDMGDQLRLSLMAIDNRSRAIQRLQKTTGFVEHIPVESLSIEICKVLDSTTHSCERRRASIELDWKVGGDRDIALVDVLGEYEYRDLFVADMSSLQSFAALQVLAKKLDHAHELAMLGY